MARIELYTTQICPYCDRAKRLLKKKGVSWEEIDVSADEQLRAFMTQRANGKRTVPQIFIDDHHVGGCDDLYELDHDGKLDKLLGL
ncbi:MAG: glutaredoxin 3 [Alphaproteobacteria bacterium]|nr:glutaredoxin 3 [Alphaproteobacteria bacterium]